MIEGDSNAVAMVHAVRTPWCRRGGALSGMSAAALGALPVRELLLRAGVLPSLVDLVVVGSARSGVSGSLGAEVAFRAGMEAAAPSVSMGDVSGERAVAEAARAILCGDVDTAVAVGVETPSDLQLGFSEPLREAVAGTKLGASATEKLRAWAGVRATDLRPTAAVLRDPITRETLAAAAEAVAQRFDIGREAQDRYAARSHERAIERARSAKADSCVPVPAGTGAGVIIVEADDGPRADLNAQSLGRAPLLAASDASLRVPSSIASVTARNLASEADGAAAVLLTRPELARSRGWPVAGLLSGARFASVDPFDQPRLGGAVAASRLLRASGLKPADLHAVECTEAGAAFVLGLLARLPDLDPEVVNAWGGSVAMGRCSGGSGVRMLGNLAGRLRESDGRVGLVIGSGAAGHGGALLLRRPVD